MDETLIIQIATATFTVVEIIKTMGMDTKYAPAVALVFAVALAWVTTGGPLSDVIVLGITAGAAAMGTYSGAKASFEKTKDPVEAESFR